MSTVFHRSRIRSDKRLTYGEVDEIFAGRASAAAPWGEPLAAAREAAAALRAKGRARAGRARAGLRVGPRRPRRGGAHEQQTESHSLIEQPMILANEQVAGYLADRKQPTLYRVHERPEPTAVAFLVEQLASLDIPTPPLPRNMTPASGRPVGGDLADRGA